MYSDEEKKFNIDITVGLIRSELLNLGEYNVHLAKLIDGGRHSTLKHIIFMFFLDLKNKHSSLLISVTTQAESYVSLLRDQICL
jgi:CCR4-NOT transcription complex subunit 1